ncbi:hypothetical protein PIB30_080156 [Stylosanthes scabra]|uniref:Secreted protein n=1 Tax=Stylosanthes scabra TaxID=79078 RepID=A0ABU6YQ56_9FABA|nr:hypothetical protein [Stylosanthes scabra]
MIQSVTCVQVAKWRCLQSCVVCSIPIFMIFWALVYDGLAEIGAPYAWSTVTHSVRFARFSLVSLNCDSFGSVWFARFSPVVETIPISDWTGLGTGSSDFRSNRPVRSGFDNY